MDRQAEGRRNREGIAGSARAGAAGMFLRASAASDNRADSGKILPGPAAFHSVA
jgi:hypothetical protein